jgi:hypothetical protein
LEEFAMCTDDKVLLEVDENISLIIGDPHGILDQQLRTRPFH